MIAEPSVAEADLAAGRLCCPVCDGPLSPWGFARERDGPPARRDTVAPPATGALPALRADARAAAGVGGARRRDGAEVIGRALLAKAHRARASPIAAAARSAAGTVRGWLRAFARRAESVAACARRWELASTHQRSRDRSPDPRSCTRSTRSGRCTARAGCGSGHALAVGARRRAHRPAARSPARPARLLSRLAGGYA